MQINIQISTHIREIIEPNIGKTIEAMSEDIIRTRINSLFKRYAPSRPAGRPRSDIQKQERALAKELRNVFINLRELFPEEFETLYGEMSRKVNEAIFKGDVKTLEWFDENKPWLTGGKVE